MPLPIIITTGEPAGVGPEVTLKAVELLAKEGIAPHQWLLLGDFDWLRHNADNLDIKLPLHSAQQGTDNAASIAVWDIPLAHPVTVTQPNANNAPYVFAQLDYAINACIEHKARAMVTAPIQKSVLMNDNNFQGHTEYLAEKTQSNVSMLLTAPLTHGRLSIALATTHIPVSAIAQALTHDTVTTSLRTLSQGLQHWFGIKAPRIAVCGLNPHAGESGKIGDEELNTIIPAIHTAQKEGIDAFGPLSADTAFFRHQPGSPLAADAFLAMYHDQGLSVFKWAASQGDGAAGVNCTLGLPFFRTSPDHGTALDIAGQGCAEPYGMIEAMRLAYHAKSAT